MTADFTFSPSSGSPLEVNFSDTSQGPVNGMSWTFGDGSPPDGSSYPVHTYPGPGSYVVALEVRDAAGNTDNAAKRVTVYEAPSASFTAMPDPSDPLSIKLTGPQAVVYAAPLGGSPPAATIDTWSWQFGDGHRGTGHEVVHRYGAQGRYTVTLQTSGPGGSASWNTDVVIGNGPPAVSFTPVVSPNDPQEISFQNTSSGNVTSWSWDFGDGHSSTDAQPLHHYQQGGSFSVTLIATGPGGSNQVTESLQVMDRVPVPVIGFSQIPTSALGLQFNADAAERVTDWEWDFGDLNQSPDQNPIHTYAAAGAYTVILKARGQGGEGVVTRRVSVGVSPPSVDFTSRPGSGMYEIEFAPVVGGTVDTLEVRFGDGDEETFTASNPASPVFASFTHTYAGAGDYPVTMTAYGPAGDPDTTHTVTVVEPPLNPSIRVSQGGGLAPITIDFDGASSGNVQNWSWDFGDGNTAGGEVVSHTYHSAGNYTATLTVSGPAGSAASSVSINVTAQLQAMANASVVSGDAPLTVSFTNQSIGQGVLSFDWDFGDGETSTETAPAHTYQQPGTYTAQLTVTDSAPPSISDSTSLVITATAVPLQARIKADRLEGHAPFTLVAEDDSIGSVAGWRWDFGDGTTPFTTADPDLGRDRIYTYTHPGRYLLSLTVSGPLPAPGHQDQAIREVIVRDPNVIPPVARINAVPVIGTSPHTVAFANTSEGTYSSVLWDFGDGTTSTTSSPTHTYGTGGDYFVTLSLLGPPPNRLPITSVSDVIAVDVGPEPGLGPPLSGSSGGVPTPAITRLSPGSGGRRPGGSGTTGMPGSSDAQMGPGWSQASVLRYEPMAGLTFAG